MKAETQALKNRILAARGEISSDLVLKNGRVVNVFTGKILRRDVAVFDGTIVGVGSGYRGREEIDAGNKYISPGLIDAHIHIESSMLPPSSLAEALAVHGTTTIVSDPHEIANVLGIEGIRFMIEDSRGAPIDIFFMAPSCVPATPLETAGAVLKAQDLAELKHEPKVLGLGEVMNFPGILMGDEDLLEKVLLFGGDVLDGHCPTLSGRALQAYLASGIRSDHEVSSRSEALEKVEGGMMIMIREGTSARNLKELVPLVEGVNSRRFCFVSDDLHPKDLMERGHLDFVLREAVHAGLEPVLAIQLATLNPAEYFGLKRVGAAAPGYRADLVLFEDLQEFRVSSVYKNGRRIAERGSIVPHENAIFRSSRLISSFNISGLTPESFGMKHTGGRARIMELIPGQIITRMRLEEIGSRDGWVRSDTGSDTLKLSVVERHSGSGRIGLGLVRGFGLKQGAIAASVAHDSHNVIAVGVDDEELYRAVREIEDMGGGLVCVTREKTLAKVPLEIAGLMSKQPLSTLVNGIDKLRGAVASLGCPLEEPFMALSFLALPVIPELKLTDMGLVDVNRFEVVPLFESQRSS